jgi:hypothetical protein
VRNRIERSPAQLRVAPVLFKKQIPRSLSALQLA